MTRTNVEGAARERIDADRLWLWEDEAGEPVALAARTATAAGVARIAPVYTPPEHRRRGYGAGSPPPARPTRWPATPSTSSSSPTPPTPPPTRSTSRSGSARSAIAAPCTSATDMRSKAWKLYAGDELVADLVVTGLDDPWLLARVEPGPGHERYRPLFAADLAEAADDDEDDDEDDEEPEDCASPRCAARCGCATPRAKPSPRSCSTSTGTRRGGAGSTSARGGTRTHTPHKGTVGFSRRRLPVPPPGQRGHPSCARGSDHPLPRARRRPPAGAARRSGRRTRPRPRRRPTPATSRRRTPPRGQAGSASCVA